MIYQNHYDNAMQNIQVGNETYSVVATEEDWERRRAEREKQKQFSQETNRRRKALEEKKKIAEEREHRKRLLQLSKRRQRQTEATEKYQRAHITAKNDSKFKKFSEVKRQTSLDSVLQQLRSGNTEISYYMSDTNAPRNVSTKQMNNSRFKFESKLKEEHERLLEEHKINTAKAFSEELNICQKDSLKHEDVEDEETLNDRPGSQRNHYTQVSSNVDIMSGQTYGSFYPVMEMPSNHTFTHLAQDLSRLFIRQEEIGADHRRDGSNLQLEDADDVEQRHVTPPKVFASAPNQSHNARFPIDVSTPLPQRIKIEEDSLSPGINDQDSLHGSIGSGTSQVLSHMTSFQKKYAVDSLDVDHVVQKPTDEVVATKVDDVKAQAVSSSDPQCEERDIHILSPTQETPNADPPPTVETATTPKYYVKSYRPWSAIEAVQEEKRKAQTRPMSAIAPHIQSLPKKAESPEHCDLLPCGAFRETTSGSGASRETASGSGTPRETSTGSGFPYPSNKWATSLARTAATPISATYREAWTKPAEVPVTSIETFVSAESPTKTVVTLAKETELIIPQQVPVSTNDVITTSTKVGFSQGTKTESVDALQDARRQNKVKSILRKVSKYGPSSKPMYHTAAVAARQQWVEHMTETNRKAKVVQTASLNGIAVRDSLDVKCKPETKSVRWHQIHYDDGTSASFSESGAITHQSHSPETTAPSPAKRSPRAGAKGSRPKPPALKGKAKSPPANEKGAKKGAKMSKGRKLKVTKETELPMEPHPPPTTRKQLSLTSTLTYSIANGVSDAPSFLSNDEMKKNLHVAWAIDDADKVTMDTLKSSGSSERVTSKPEMELKSPSRGGSIPDANQVTLNVVSPSMHEVSDSEVNLSKTPTDQEINWLWDKVRGCLSQRPANRNPPVRSTSSSIRLNGTSSGFSRQTSWTSAVTQQRASIVSIDGGMFMRDNNATNNHRRVIRPSSAVMTSSRQRMKDASLQRQALLQQRRSRFFPSQRIRPELVKSVGKYPSPRPSYFDPMPSPSTRRRQVDESTTAFLLAETLAEQNMSEEQILNAMDSLQKRTRQAQVGRGQVVPSALSMEEQRLLKSLERLNTRLREVEVAIAANPSTVYISPAQVAHESSPFPSYGYRGNRIHSADAINHRPLKRY